MNMSKFRAEDAITVHGVSAIKLSTFIMHDTFSSVKFSVSFFQPHLLQKKKESLTEKSVSLLGFTAFFYQNVPSKHLPYLY